MLTELDKRAAKVADLIVDELTRLNCDAKSDPYSGLMTRIPNVVTNEVLIEIYDDYASGIYDGEDVLEHLKTLKPDEVSLDSESGNNIWHHIMSFVV